MRRRHSPKDNVFWWIDPTDPRNVFNEAKEALGMKDDGRTLHTLRGSAEWWWENVLEWDDRTICDYAGHTSRVRHQHYRTIPTYQELADRLRKHLG
jgi:integrase